MDATKTNINKCALCQKDLAWQIVNLSLCQTCFDADAQKSIALIEQKLQEINGQIKKMDQVIAKLNLAIAQETNLLIKYKYQVDLINLETLVAKLKVDWEANQKSKTLTLEHYEQIYQINQWKK